MKNPYFYLILVGMALLLAACGGASETVTVAPDAAGRTPQAAEPGAAYPSVAEPAAVEPAAVEAYPAPEAEAAQPAASCASAEATELGASIAADYAFTTTEQVMGWFCAGAEFEDILTALETAEQTGASAEEMLQMLAAGMTWEEIWQVVGLTGQQP